MKAAIIASFLHAACLTAAATITADAITSPFLPTIRPEDIGEKVLLSFLMCAHVKYGGECKHLYIKDEINKCFDFMPAWRDVISAIKPDRGTGCAFYEGKRCNAGSPKGMLLELNLVYPEEEANLVVSPKYPGPGRTHINDRIKSFKCWKLD
ncbi:hypothetical protein BJ508DRAFT_303756 [Ascobolus immersus RN42]|uniref:Uncharacterized protein n=1 Tax=Ascobolus immersus RN42 TaxID=1160509 RepID=A0A3N4ISR7_ASCIM|nr:hypothetical protein BJ508DRAFT_303756 [Ascobolus immersus RN42]